ncbi:MAG: hypothetical protein GY854_13580 [Deltaproteobacteria bacterium]|nr:hypothetical protein [Deltaproteobacteria bacterium]
MPEIASSAGYSGYAVEYPGRLQILTEMYNQREVEARELFATFPSFPDELSEPSWGQVVAVMERADESGRSRAHVEHVEETAHVRAFFNEEKDEITRRVSGAVKAAQKKAECECKIEAYGKVSYALKDSVNKQMDRRTTRRSEARRLIDRYKKSLGKKNIKPLEKQANAVMRASYIVYIELAELYTEIDSRVSEARRVKGTIEDALEAEREFATHPETPKAEKKASEKRIAELEEAKSSLDASVKGAEEIVSSGEMGIPAIRKEYDTAFDRLCDVLSERESEFN